MTTRRTLLIAAGASTLVAPFASLAQQPARPADKPWRIGVLVQANWEQNYAHFKDGLRELGLVEGRNILIEFRSAQANIDALPGLAAELVRLKVDVIVAFQTPCVLAAKQATSSIPIVMGAADPVGSGIVTSLARPGGNITGVAGLTAELSAKMLELVRELRPGAKRVGVLANAKDPFTKTFVGQIENAGVVTGIEIRTALVRGVDDYAAAFATWAKLRVDAVIVQTSLPPQRAIELALQHRLPSMSARRAFAEAGGLLSYAANVRDRGRKLAAYVDRILKGAKPADLPVEQPTRFELLINGKTVKALGLKLPQSLLIRADQVIE